MKRDDPIYGEEWLAKLRAELRDREKHGQLGLGRAWNAIKQLLIKLDAK